MNLTKMFIRLIFAVTVSFFYAFSLSAQVGITGVVNDDTGSPMPGVNVIVKNTTTGSVTDVNGKYTISVPDDNAILQFSSIGFATQEITVGNRRVIDVDMAEDAQQIEEVVVVGYGTMKKSDLTGSVHRLSADEHNMQANTQITDMLAGTIAGFNAIQSYSAEGGSTMEIRGPTSLGTSNTPLVVVDGAIFFGTLSDINPADVESIDVLKDASSAAVYGSRAAAGVILITTKQGKKGKPTINASVKLGVAQPKSSSVKPHDAESYPIFRRDVLRIFDARTKTFPEYYFFSPDDLPGDVSVNDWMGYRTNPAADPTTEWLTRLNFTPLEQEKYLAGESINWFDEVVTNAFRQDYSVSIRGGADKVSYYYSLGYLNNEGIIRGDAFEAVRSRLNLDFTVTDWLNVGINTMFSNRDNSAISANYGALAAVSPYANMFNADGTVKFYPHDYSVANPLIDYYEQERSNTNVGLFTRMFAKLTLPYGFSYELSYQPRFAFGNTLNFWNTNTLTGSNTYQGGRGERVTSKWQEWNLDNLLHWNKEFGVHKFFVTLLYNSRKSQSWQATDANSNFSPSQQLIYNGLQFGAAPTTSNNDTYETGDAMMGRINYNLMDKYLLTASVRRDGYSAFGQENPRAIFPAVAVAWAVSNESFYNTDWFANRLKLRFSWGVNGNSDIGRYAALAQLASVQYSDGTNIKTGVYNNTLANSSLRWERTQAINFGFEMGLLNNRIDISADFYNMTTTDLLMKRDLPEITGYNEIMSNLGELANRGIEFTINTVNFNRDNFSWNSNFLFSMNRNKIVHLFGDYEEVEINGETVRREVNDYDNNWFIGQPIDVVWDYDITGMWQMEEAEEAAKYNLIPGDVKAHDVDGNSKYEALTDKKYIGYTRPRFRLGTSQTFRFLKNFSASVFIRADLGHVARFSLAERGGHEMYNRQNYWDTPYWTPENRSNDYPNLTSTWMNQYGDGIRIFKPCSFLRVQDLSLAYTLPSQISNNFNLNSLRVYASIRNLCTLTKWPGNDPENTANFPMPRIFTLGVDISL